MRRSVAESVRAVFGERDDVPVNEIYAVAFAAYSQQELLRFGTHCTSSAISRDYRDGKPISDDARMRLLMIGVKRAARCAAKCHRGVWFVIDDKKGVASRVRREVAG